MNVSGALLWSVCVLQQPHLIRMMTEGVWAMAPIMLHTQITHRKVRKACWQPGLGHFPGSATASSLELDIHVQLVRFCHRDTDTQRVNVETGSHQSELHQLVPGQPSLTGLVQPAKQAER